MNRISATRPDADHLSLHMVRWYEYLWPLALRRPSRVMATQLFLGHMLDYQIDMLLG